MDEKNGIVTEKKTGLWLKRKWNFGEIGNIVVKSNLLRQYVDFPVGFVYNIFCDIGL